MPPRKHRPARSPAPPDAPELRDLPSGAARSAVLLFFGLLAVYCSNLRLLGAGDSIPTRLLPFSILREGDLDLDEFTWQLTRRGRWPYYIHESGGHFYSVSTIATPLVITPLYILPAWVLAHYAVAYDDVRARVLIVVMERVSAATLTALSAVFVFLALCRIVDRRWAIGLALTYGFGTSAWSISSQALWPHALAALSIAIVSAVFLAPRAGTLAIAAAGIAAALGVANRPPMIVFAALAAFEVWRRDRRQLIAFAALPAIGAAALLVYNLSVFHASVGAYQRLNLFSASVLTGIAGLFVSPNRGLVVYTPIMAFAFAGAARAWRVGPPWMRLLIIGTGLHVAIYGAFSEWWAGYTFGPRYFTDVLPVLTLFLAYALVPRWRRPAARAVAALLIAYGIAVQIVGVYFADDDWNRHPFPLERRPNRVWDWSDLQIARALASGWKGTEMAPLLAAITRDPRPVPLAALQVGDLAAGIDLLDAPRSLRHGEKRDVVVRLTNRGDKPWPAFSGEGSISVRYLVVLVIRWFADGKPLGGEGDVVRLPANLAPNRSIDLHFELAAPAHPGAYELDFRVSQALDGMHGVVGPSGLRLPIRVE
jgi:hypothetical protein